MLVGTFVFATGVAFTMPALLALAVSRVPPRSAGPSSARRPCSSTSCSASPRSSLGFVADARGYGAAFVVSAVLAASPWAGRRPPAASTRPVPVAAGRLSGDGDRRGVRRRRRAHGPRHRPGLRRDRAAGRALRAGPGPRRSRPRPDRRATSIGPSRRAASRRPTATRPARAGPADRRHRRCRPCRPRRRGDVRGRGGQARLLEPSSTRVRPAGAIFASNTSSISIDTLAAAVAAGRRGRIRRDALLQPGAGHAARSSWSAAPRRRTRRRRRCATCPPTSASGHRLGRPTRVHRQPDADAVPRRGDAGARGGRRQRGGHRRGREGRAQPPDGPARAGRLHRAGRLQGHHGGAPRGLRRGSLPAAAGARRPRRGRPPRPEDGPRLPRIPPAAERPTEPRARATRRGRRRSARPSPCRTAWRGARRLVPRRCPEASGSGCRRS